MITVVQWLHKSCEIVFVVASWCSLVQRSFPQDAVWLEASAFPPPQHCGWDCAVVRNGSLLMFTWCILDTVAACRHTCFSCGWLSNRLWWYSVARCSKKKGMGLMLSQQRLIHSQFLSSHLKAQLIQGQPKDLAITCLLLCCVASV